MKTRAPQAKAEIKAPYVGRAKSLAGSFSEDREHHAEADEPGEAKEDLGSDAFTLYLREIGQIKLLTPNEEIQLANRIKKGDREAREQMIKANLRLVVKIARDYMNCGLPLLDLISEGNIGLMCAVQRFNPCKGAKLSTYAAFWIKQAIRRALANQSKTIRLPVHVVDKLLRIRRVESRLRTEIGHDPSDAELSEELHIPTKRIAEYRRASVAPTSLDALFSENNSHSFAEVVPDENAKTPCQELEGKVDVALIRSIVETLDPREQAVLRARFGLDGADEQTLEDIGKGFGVTRERIRQVETIALTKLRNKLAELDSVQAITA